MSPRVHFHPEAALELRQARDYYRDVDSDLAARLLAENKDALGYIGGFPLAGPLIFGTYRYVVLPHFPYMLVYAPQSHPLRILAVFHVRRDPGWMRRQLEERG